MINLVCKPATVIAQPRPELANTQGEEPAEPKSINQKAVPASQTTPVGKNTTARTSNKMLGSCNKMKQRTWTEMARNQAGIIELLKVTDLGQQVSSRRKPNCKNKNKPKLNTEAENKTNQAELLAGLEHEDEPMNPAKMKNKLELNTEVEKKRRKTLHHDPDRSPATQKHSVKKTYLDSLVKTESLGRKPAKLDSPGLSRRMKSKTLPKSESPLN